MTAIIALLGGWRATAFAAALLGALAWGGIQSFRLKAAHESNDTLTVKLAAADDRIEAFRLLLGQVNAVADEEIRKARDQAHAGEQAAAQAETEAERLAERLTTTQAALQDAKADPTCAEQLKVKLCSAIPLL